MRGLAIAWLCACTGTIGTGHDNGTGGTGDHTDAARGSDLDGRAAGDGGTSAAVGPYFATPMFFNRDVSGVAKASDSDTMIAALVAAGGWGNSNAFQIDFSIDVLTATSVTPMESFTPTSDWSAPDCDAVAVPVPAGGDLEDESGYACTGDGDCHLLVYDPALAKLYEMWRANITTTFQGGCLAVWNLSQTYTDTLRGDQCTSADAAGYPMSPMLFTADEVAAGHIDHAIRFILPNSRVRRGYTRPATHATNTTGSASAPAYGVHLRLRADYPIASLPSDGARVVARALQKYGMYHADGGEIALTARTDKHTTAKWSGLLDSHDLAALSVSDFEVIDNGAMIPLTFDCARN